jgi:hypothetical protein
MSQRPFGGLPAVSTSLLEIRAKLSAGKKLAQATAGTWCKFFHERRLGEITNRLIDTNYSA